MPTIDIDQFPDTIDAFGGDRQRALVFLDRYARKDRDGQPAETLPIEMWSRVAEAIARDDEQRVRFINLLADFKFVPGGRILAGAGTGSEVTFYNCYVIPVETKVRREWLQRADMYESTPPAPWDKGNDSREAIIDTVGVMVDIMSRGGGVGINWSTLRPKGAYLKSINATSSGPVDWMHFASTAVGTVEQGGSRRGAAMFMLDDWHPDILDFINAKRDNSRITNANISVAVSDTFMEAVKNDEPWDLVFPDTTHPAYNTGWDGNLSRWLLAHHDAFTVYKTLPARDIWDAIAESAHASGEPGVVFIDRYNKQRTASYVGEGKHSTDRIISVNPCGEQGLEPYAVCNLGAMNLDAYLKPDKSFGSQPRVFDWALFASDVAEATEFLDRVIDVNYYFLPENEAIQKRLRRVGLGVMGLADVLIALRLRYGSPAAVAFTERVFATMKTSAVARSAGLAATIGPAPAWERDMVRSPYLSTLPEVTLNAVARQGLRNLFLLTQAPTGTTSILAGVNSGIEPYFAFEYTRNDRTGSHRVRAGAVEKYTPKRKYIDEPLPDYCVTASEVTVEQHIAMQAAAQKFIDSSVSKTINAPASQTVYETANAFAMAYESGLKGLAYYRDGSRDVQVLNRAPDASPERLERLLGDLMDANDRIETLENMLEGALTTLDDVTDDFERPNDLRGVTRKVHTAAGTAYVTVNYSDDEPVEVFINVGKAGSDITELGEALGRLISLSLRHGARLGGVANQLEGIGGSPKFNKPLAHAIGEALTSINAGHEVDSIVGGALTFEPEEEEDVAPYPVNGTGGHIIPDLLFPVIDAHFTPKSQQNTGQLCSECQNFSVVLEEGCKKCHLCGWSAC